MKIRSLPLLATALAACATTPAEGDPTLGEVRLDASSGWNATLMLDLGKPGIWTVEPLPVFEQFASPEVVALDDRGRCHVLVSYSGKWTPKTTIEDGVWLGAIAQGDVDASIDGSEIYVAGKAGNVYQVVPTRAGVLESRRIANLDEREVHTLVAGDLIPWAEGNELLAFTSPGGLYLLTEWGGGEFDVELVSELSGRVRDAFVLPAVDGAAPGIVTVSRNGRLEILKWSDDGPHWMLVHELPMGMGRVDCDQSGGALVIYNTCDDGTLWRHAPTTAGDFSHEMIYAGPQGPRGIALGRFHEDAQRESLALFGYSGRVELLSNGPDGWTVETLFTDRDKGHWLAAGEFDGRNATEELVLSGYGARVVLLSRPPGYGLGGVLTEPEPEPEPEAAGE